MNSSIETREVVTVAVDGNRLLGTYHKSCDGASDARSAPSGWNRVGVLFLNPGFLPRASPSAIYWADSFAKCGYPAFRFDLPGLGDSEGNVPDRMLDYVSAGGYAPVLSAIVKEIADRYRLAGVVIMGLCAGAVTSLFTAAVAKECKGVVLMDPYFSLPQERIKLRDELSQWATWSRLGATTSEIYHRLRHIRLVQGGNKPPRNANFALIKCWKQLASAGTPILVLKAPAVGARGIKPRAGSFDYLEYLGRTSGRSGRVFIKFIEGTNHSFADDAGRTAVREHTLQWLKECFPFTVPQEAITLKKTALAQTPARIATQSGTGILAL